MWVTIIACVLVAAMLIGPIMMLQPNKYQKRLARLRMLAAKQGIQVSIVNNPASGEPRQLAMYSCRITTLAGSDKKTKRWCLARQRLEHELNFVADWDWVGAGRPPDAIRGDLRALILELPAPICAVETTEDTVAFYWTENCWYRLPRWEASAQKCIEFVEVQLKELAQLVG